MNPRILALAAALFSGPFLIWAVEPTLDQAKAAFASADQALNAVYAKARTELPEWIFPDLQKDQREWLTYRDERALQAAVFDGGAVEGEEQASVEYWTAREAVTTERIAIVEAWLKHDQFDREWEGHWRDGSGGSLSIAETGEGVFAFTLEVVRGPTHHLGFVHGGTTTNGRTARFSVKEVETLPETWLTFVKRGHRLEIIGENTQPFHGARAYFDGSYLRVAPLSPGDRGKILAPEEP